jgi:hypothetical protein
VVCGAQRKTEDEVAMKIWMAVAIAASVMGVAAAQADSTTGAGAPGEKDLAPAVKAFLAQHGDLCLAWYTWPRDLTAEEQQGGLNEAVQMPVLERLGLVQSADVAATSGPVKRYSLTALLPAEEANHAGPAWRDAGT